MSKNDLRMRDRFTFSLSGIPVASSFGVLPIIANDRIRMAMKSRSESSQKALGAESQAAIHADAVEGEYA